VKTEKITPTWFLTTINRRGTKRRAFYGQSEIESKDKAQGYLNKACAEIYSETKKGAA